MENQTTFDQPLVGTIGEKMFYTFSHVKKVNGINRLVLDASRIRPVEIYGIQALYQHGVILHARDKDDNCFCGVQEMFFRSRESAEEMIRKVKEYQKNVEPYDWKEELLQAIEVDYRYQLTFPVQPLQEMEGGKVVDFSALILADKVNITYFVDCGNHQLKYHKYDGLGGEYKILAKL